MVLNCLGCLCYFCFYQHGSFSCIEGLLDSNQITFENSEDNKAKVVCTLRKGTKRYTIPSNETIILHQDTTAVIFNGETISLLDSDDKCNQHCFFYDNLVLNYFILSPKKPEGEKSSEWQRMAFRDYRATSLDFGQLCGDLSSFTLDEDALSKAKLCASYSTRAYDLHLYEDDHAEEDLCYAHHDVKEQISFTRWAVWFNEASKHIVLAFRGSSEVYDFLVDAGIYPKRLCNNFGISSGVLTMIENEWGDIVKQIGKIVTAHGGGKDLSLLLTGHSLGGGLAQALLMWILLKMKDEHSNVFVGIPRENIQSWTFAGQNVFYMFAPSGSDLHNGLDAEMVELFERFEPAAHNFANLYDPVPFSPRIVASQSFGSIIAYKSHMAAENVLIRRTAGRVAEKLLVHPLINKTVPVFTKLSELSSFCRFYQVLAQTVILYVDKSGQQHYLGVSAANYPEMLDRCLNLPDMKNGAHPWLGRMTVGDHELRGGQGVEEFGYWPVLSKL